MLQCHKILFCEHHLWGWSKWLFRLLCVFISVCKWFTVENIVPEQPGPSYPAIVWLTFSGVSCGFCPKCLHFSRCTLHAWGCSGPVSILYQAEAENNQESYYIWTSLVVQWLRPHTPDAGAPGSISGWGTKFHMPQLRVLMP